MKVGLHEGGCKNRYQQCDKICSWAAVGLDDKTAKNSRSLNALLSRRLFSKKEALLYIFLVNKKANELSHLKLLNSSSL